MKLLGQYQNGNYTVRIYDDGTKIRSNDEDRLIPQFPESIDLKITNRCDMACPFCHENSTPRGEHGDILNLPFLKTLRPYTELAIGGGNPLAHPDLIAFLEGAEKLNLISNITVNQTHFLENLPLLHDLTDHGLIHGLGVSYTTPGTEKQLREALQEFPNAVLHVIAGIVDPDDLQFLAGNALKLLILGYKTFRRGGTLYNTMGGTINSYINALKEILPEMLRNYWFKAVSFDNLAISQLNVRRLMSDEEWEKFYMGDDGKYTMYIDAVRREFAASSTSRNRYALEPDIDTMFQMIHAPEDNCLDYDGYADFMLYARAAEKAKKATEQPNL